MSKRIWLTAILLLVLVAVLIQFSQPEEGGREIRGNDFSVEESRVVKHNVESNEIDPASVIPRSAATSPESPEPDIEQFNPLGVWTRYSQRSAEGDLDATYILAFVINKCRNVDAEDFVGHIERSTVLSPEMKAREFRRFERCLPLVELVGDLGKAHDRLYQTLHDQWHPLTMVNVPGIPPTATQDRLVHALMGNYPEQFMYERAYMAALVFERERSDSPNAHRVEAWTILYCEAHLECNSRNYLADLRATKYHDHEIDDILAIVDGIRTAVQNGNPDELGL